jgi:TolB-like protein
MNDDPEQKYSSDGIYDYTTRQLSGISKLAVIARNLSFRYKRKVS